VPLTERLTNVQFGKIITKLATRPSRAPRGSGGSRLCQCGCGSPVAATRRFVDQSHYDVWRSRYITTPSIRWFDRALKATTAPRPVLLVTATSCPTRMNLRHVARLYDTVCRDTRRRALLMMSHGRLKAESLAKPSSWLILVVGIGLMPVILHFLNALDHHENAHLFRTLFGTGDLLILCTALCGASLFEILDLPTTADLKQLALRRMTAAALIFTAMICSVWFSDISGELSSADYSAAISPSGNVHSASVVVSASGDAVSSANSIASGSLAMVLISSVLGLWTLQFRESSPSAETGPAI
jgi:hypothetical protein